MQHASNCNTWSAFTLVSDCIILKLHCLLHNTAGQNDDLCSHPTNCHPYLHLTGMHMIRYIWYMLFNTLRQRRNEQHSADDIFKRVFFNENACISTKTSLKFVPKGPINNIPALVRMMAWRRSGDKPLSEPMMVSLPTHIYVTRPQWDINIYRASGPLQERTVHW